jgi:hypothetical protein
MNVPRSGVFPRLDKRNLEGFENIWLILYVCQRGVLKKRIILKKCKKIKQIILKKRINLE